jgi:hypothetical protein
MLLRKPRAWCQGVSARDRHDLSCDPKDRDAVKWCMSGALEHFTPFLDNTAQSAAKMALSDAIEQVSGTRYAVVEYNDKTERTKKQVLRVFDLAIKTKEQEKRKRR